MHQHQIEGTSRELTAYLSRHAGQRFRLIALSSEDSSTVSPNEEVLRMLEDLSRIKAGMASSDATETDRLLGEARSGKTYSDGSDGQ